MQVTPTLTEGLKRAFTVVVPSADLQAHCESRLKEIARDIRLPGFRPGKVPAAVVKQRHGEAVRGEALERLVQDKISKLLEEHKIRPAFQPKVELLSGNQEGQEIKFSLEMEVLPEFEIPDFTDLKLTRLTSKVSDDVLEKALADVARRSRKFEELNEDRAAVHGDVLNVNFVGKLEGTPFEGGTAQDVNVEIGGEGFIPGFAEQMEGMKAGEERVINVTFPENYQAQELAGKAVTFDIKVNALKRAIDPVLDDEFAKTLGLESIEQMRTLITEQAQGEYAQLTRLRIKRDLLDALAAKVSFEVPPTLVESEFNQIWNRVEEERKAGRLSAEEVQKDEAELRSDYHAIAERRVRLGLLLSEIGQKQDIKVSREELFAAMQQEAARYPGQEQMVFEFFTKNPQAVENLRGPILENKVVDYLIEMAEVSEKEVTPEELADMPEITA